jgi:hypothetical protein
VACTFIVDTELPIPKPGTSRATTYNKPVSLTAQTQAGGQPIMSNITPETPTIEAFIRTSFTHPNTTILDSLDVETVDGVIRVGSRAHINVTFLDKEYPIYYYLVGDFDGFDENGNAVIMFKGEQQWLMSTLIVNLSLVNLHAAIKTAVRQEFHIDIVASYSSSLRAVMLKLDTIASSSLTATLNRVINDFIDTPYT